MGKMGLAALVLGAISAAGWGFQTWLDRRHVDKHEVAYIGALAFFLTVLLVALFLHFARFK